MGEPKPQTNRRGRPRVTLDELHVRWRTGNRATVERNAKRSVDALYEEMLAFMPDGLADDVSLVRFLSRYQSELECIFQPPFAPAPTAEDLKHQAEVRAALGDIGDMHATGVVAVTRARVAYQFAQEHAWRRDGSVGPPPPPLTEDGDKWFEEQLQTLERIRRAIRRGPTQAAAPPNQPPTRPGPERQPPTEPGEPPDLGDEVTRDPPGESWTDHVTWDGKEQTMSPRDAMRPYLETQGRLDLLELYDDKVVQYGPVVRRWIDGRLR